jgi:hypothetical protein
MNRLETNDDFKKLNLITTLTPEDAVKRIKALVADVLVETFGLRIAPPGVPVAKVAANIELFANKVIPHFSQ